MSAPRPEARHASGRARTVWPGVFRTLLVVLTVLAVSAGSLVAFAAWRLGGEIRTVDIGPKPQNPAALDGAFTVLLVGADNAPGQAGFGKARDAVLNDVNILVHVDADHRSGTVISLPRDLVIPQPQCTDPKTGHVSAGATALPLNNAFGRGGLACVVTTVHALTGMDVPYAALFSFEGTVKMADAVGGVPVCVTKAVNDTDSGLKLKKGVTVVKGRQALAYLRSRHGVGDGSDLSRIQSQQAYMSALLRKMTSASTFANPVQLYRLATATAKNVSVSDSLGSTDTMVRMAVALKSMDLSRFVFVQYPTLPDPVNDQKVVPNAPLAAALTDRVRKDEPIALDKDALGAGAVERSPSATPTGSATPRPTATDRGTIAGLKGRTAAQQTCSVANPHP